jgi:paraquat-inducible protein A
MEAIVACPTCNLMQRVEELEPGMLAECGRCGSIIARRGHDSIVRTAALSLAALTLYGAYTGMAFPLYTEAKKEWLDWSPR